MSAFDVSQSTFFWISFPWEMLIFFLFLFIIETPFFLPIFVSNVLSTFSFSNSIMLICMCKVVPGALSMAGCKAVGAGSSGWVQRQLCRKPCYICALFPTSYKPSLSKNRVTVCTLNLLVFFGEHDGGDGLGTSTSKPCLGFPLHKWLVSAGLWIWLGSSCTQRPRICARKMGCVGGGHQAVKLIELSRLTIPPVLREPTDKVHHL